jgi:bifunctional non-homologous end joining protein LigD
MLASLADAPLDDPQLVYEPKYDGIRAIVQIAAGGAVHLWSRLGNEKTHQFPEIAAALERWAKRRNAPLVLDGEIVALDGKGEPTGFQQLQGRIHLQEASGGRQGRVALIAFDVLRDGDRDFRDRPWTERRAALERIFGKTGSPILRISHAVRGDGQALFKDAMEQGWEGLIAKHADSLYKSGKRTPDWRKLKIVHEQEFVVGGWTDPRQTRAYFGALLLGVYAPMAPGTRPEAAKARSTRHEAPTTHHEAPNTHHEAPNTHHQSPNTRLVYVGHTGTGFNEKELARLMKLLRPLATAKCPFVPCPKTNERPHWVRPELVAQIKFTEWTTDGKLRHPVYLGLRDDKRPTEVVREESKADSRRSAFRPKSDRIVSERTAKPESHIATDIIDQLRALEEARKDGVLSLPGGKTLKVTNLHKVFWPEQKLTKGDLFRYYARVAPVLLPAIADRPLVMKRFPNGVNAPPFYQHRASVVPAGIRTEVVSVVEQRPQIIGGSLDALMYTTQLAAISQDPWFSRVPDVEYADFAALDLDPADGVPFERVLDVARWIHEELDRLGAVGVAKTSGADGLHIYIPLPPHTPYDAGMLYCQIVATMVTHKHPKVATVERSVRARGQRVYIDCLQNILGKTLASAYSARASDYAGVSTPVSWKEVDAGFDRRAFTIETVPDRVEQVGDLWAVLRTHQGVDLAKITRYAQSSRG